MDIGYFGLNMGAFCEPDPIALLLERLESGGFESAWTGEHVVLVDPQEPPSPVAPESPFLDTIATLAFAASATTRLKLGSGIILLAQRQPIILAKELAGIDILSKGRLLFGVGVGYVKGEFDALGIPYEERGPRVSEHIEAIRTLWTQEQPSFEGRFSSFSGIQSRPLPVQRPHPPILVGGASPPAFRRAVAQGDGWYGFYQDLDATAVALRGLEDAAKHTERPKELGSLEISITPPGPVDRDTMRRYEDLGVSRLVVMRSFEDMSRDSAQDAKQKVLDFVSKTSDDLALG